MPVKKTSNKTDKAGVTYAVGDDVNAKMKSLPNPLAVILLLMGIAWLVLLASGDLSRIVGKFANALPTWLSGVIIAALVFSGGLAVLDLRLNWRLRLAFYCFVIVCCSLFPIAWNKYPIRGTVAVVLLYGEVFWLGPQINEKLKGSRGL
jgi:hypothetical protein